MTIRAVHRPAGYAYTLDEYRELMANRTRPLTNPAIGATTTARRNNDAAASAAFDNGERPSTKTRWRPVGPRGHPTDAEDRRADATRRGTRTAREAGVWPGEPLTPPKRTTTPPNRQNANTDR